MIEQILKNVPDSWEVVELNEIGIINPKIDKSLYEDDKVCSFVPMPAVEAESGKIDVSETRIFSQVKKGYTPFLERDVLFAKITPCMENGKVAVVPKLIGDLGFGSTEFHVVRPYSCIDESYVFYYLVSQIFRYEAERNMTGAVGQRRVPTPWLSSVKIPLPPQKEQQRIVEKVEELFSELDKGVESLNKAKQQLVIYRQSVLKQAFNGMLTEQWRKDNPDKKVSPNSLIDTVKEEREARYEGLLRIWEADVDAWKENNKQGKKPAKPKLLDSFRETQKSGSDDYPAWTYFGNLCEYITSGSRGWAKYYASYGSTFIRAQNLKHDRLELSDIAYVDLPSNIEGKRTLTKVDDILITITGANVTKSALVVEDLGEAYISQHVALCRLINSSNSTFIFRYLIAGSGGRRQLEGMAYGAGKPGLNLDNIKDVLVPVFSLDECMVINEKLDAVESGLQKIEQEISSALDKANLIRQSILKKAFSGQLVSQDLKDESASELLKKIAIKKEEIAEKERADNAAARKKKATAKKIVKS